jgi:V/A-type H+/Na+-transporting ATPase subunit D
VPLALELAVMRASLERLIAEYIRTERRARALENVVLPEIEGSLRFMDEQLEAMDQEEAIRVRNAGR